MSTVIVTEEEERLCGTRKTGGYLVSASNVTDGNIHVGEEAAGLIMLAEPVPVDPREVPKRGFIYIEGDAVHSANAEKTPILRIEAAEAARRAFAWCAFGLAWEERANRGLLAGVGDALLALTTLEALPWGDRDGYLRAAVLLKGKLDILRGERGEVASLPLTVGIMDAYNTALDGHWRGTSLRGAGATVAATWRLLQAARWCNAPDAADCAATSLLPHAGAQSDSQMAADYQPRRRLPPDIADWVGERYYPTVASFAEEDARLGISRRCPSGGPPKGVVSGWSRAYLAHAKCQFADGTEGPGIFGYYLVAQMQYVVGQDMKVPPAYRQRGSQGVEVRHLKKKR